MIGWLGMILFGPTRADRLAYNARLDAAEKEMDQENFERRAMQYAAEKIVAAAREGKCIYLLRHFGKWQIGATYQTFEEDPSLDPEPVGLAHRDLKAEQREQAIDQAIGKTCRLPNGAPTISPAALTCQGSCARCGNPVISGLGGGVGVCGTCVAVQGDDYYLGTHLADD